MKIVSRYSHCRWHSSHSSMVSLNSRSARSVFSTSFLWSKSGQGSRSRFRFRFKVKVRVRIWVRDQKLSANGGRAHLMPPTKREKLMVAISIMQPPSTTVTSAHPTSPQGDRKRRLGAPDAAHKARGADGGH